MTPEETKAAVSDKPIGGRFGIVLPSGERLGGNQTRREVLDALVFMPHGSRIDPPIPEANPVALNHLDAICDSRLNAIGEARVPKTEP